MPVSWKESLFLYAHSRRFWFFIFLLTVFLRVAALYTPFLDIDEAQFAGFSHVLMDGGLPYRDSLDTKSLGIYFFLLGVFFGVR